MRTAKGGCETPLRAWCEATDTTPFAVSKGLGVAHSAVWKWYKGLTLPSLVLAAKLEEWTDGGVLLVAWLGTDLAKAQYNWRPEDH